MTTIKNYDSRSKLSNYQIGSVYTFYLHNINMNRLVKIEEKDAQQYVKVLNDVIETNVDLVKNNDKYFNFTRVIGVVIDKHESTTPNSVDQITVMFKTSIDDYVLNKYAVNTSNVLTNEKNYFLPAAVIDINQNIIQRKFKKVQNSL